MIVAEMVRGKDGLERQYAIRKSVFVQEQKVDIQLERDEYDLISNHVIVYENDVPVGTGRIIDLNGTYLIGRIAVLKDYRGKKYGDLIVRKLVDYGFRNFSDRIEVHAQVQVIDFYKTIGFIEYGDVFEEAGIQHKSMYITPMSFKKPCDNR